MLTRSDLETGNAVAQASSAVPYGRETLVYAESRVEMLQMYTAMVRIRKFEERVRGAYLEGLVYGTTHLCIGQEAVCAMPVDGEVGGVPGPVRIRASPLRVSLLSHYQRRATGGGNRRCRSGRARVRERTLC